jgi:histidinol-phosphate aminotransferase
MSVTRRGFVNLLGAGTVGSLLVPTGTAIAAPALSGHALAGRGLEALLGGRESPPETGTLIRLDSNENPNGPGRAALAAIGATLGESSRYADASVATLATTVARQLGVEPASVCLGCGSTDVLRAAVYAFTGPGRPLVTAAPTYEAPGRDAARLGAEVRAVPVDGDLRLDLARMAEASRGAGLVFLCNPNNPTGTVHGREAVADFVARVLRDTPTATILVDEAYHDYVDDPRYATAIPIAMENPRVIVARTFSKAHGMAGLRVGYAVGQRATIEAIDPHTLNLGVNALGAAAAAASATARDHIERERRLNRDARDYTRRFFTDAGFKPAASETNFVMVDIRRDVKAFREACRAQGVAVGRLFPPLSTHARVSIGTMDEMRRATAVFRKVLAT